MAQKTLQNLRNVKYRLKKSFGLFGVKSGINSLLIKLKPA